MKLTYADESNVVYCGQCRRCGTWYYSDRPHECQWTLPEYSPPPLERRRHNASMSLRDALEDVAWTYGWRWPLVVLREAWRAMRPES